MRSPRPSKYCVEYIPLAVVAQPAYDAFDPDPWLEYDDAPTLKEAREIVARVKAAGVVSNRATIYRRFGFTYRPEDNSWDYWMERSNER